MTTLSRWAERTRMPPLLLRFWAWIVASALLSLLATAGMIVFLHNKFAYGILVLWNDGFFWDLLVFQERFQRFRTPQFWDAFRYPFSYPAAMGVVFAMLYRIPHVLRWYLLACIAALAGWSWIMAREVARRCGCSARTALLFSMTIAATAWPVWLLLCSANTEGLVAMIVAAGVWAVLRRRWWLGAGLIAVAGSLKIFPVALLALLLSRRRYKEFAFGVVLAIAITFGSLAILGPTITEAQRHITAGLVFVKEIYALSVTQYAPDVSHSLFAPIKFSVVLVYRVLHPDTWRAGQTALLNATYNIYVVLVCLFGVLIYLVRIRILPMLNQVFALTCCAILLPPYSVDYTLLHLFLPLGLLCVYAAETYRDSIRVRGLRGCFLCFALLFPIGTFFTLKYRFGSLVRAFALTALLVVVLRFPFPWDELDRSSREASSR